MTAAWATSRMTRQYGVNLAQLDPEPPDLDLIVHPAPVLELPSVVPPGQVPGPVHPVAGAPCGSATNRSAVSPGRFEIAARQLLPGYVQLTLAPHRNRLQVLVQHMHPGVRNGRPMVSEHPVVRSSRGSTAVVQPTMVSVGPYRWRRSRPGGPRGAPAPHDRQRLAAKDQFTLGRQSRRAVRDQRKMARGRLQEGDRGRSATGSPDDRRSWSAARSAVHTAAVQQRREQARHRRSKDSGECSSGFPADSGTTRRRPEVVELRGARRPLPWGGRSTRRCR